MMVSKFAPSEKWRNWFTWLEGLFFRSDVFFLPRYKICKANAIRGFFQNLDIFFCLGDMRFSFVSVQKNHTVTPKPLKQITRFIELGTRMIMKQWTVNKQTGTCYSIRPSTINIFNQLSFNKQTITSQSIHQSTIPVFNLSKVS